MKVAIVGSGCSGLAATWALNEYSDHEVHLYESDSRPGGHADTVSFTNPKNGETTMVDTGFIVFNLPNYPNFYRFLRILGSKIVDTEMTFSLSRDDGKFEWAGDTLFTLFCQPRNLLKGSMWRMIWDILRFNASARKFVVESKKGTAGEKDATSIGEYLDRNGYSESFRDNYLMPMTAAIWSTPPSVCAEGFPARALLHFMHNHHLLQILRQPKWYTFVGGSIEYVTRVTSKLPKAALKLGSAVIAVSSEHINGKTKVTIRTADGRTEEYDHVILACHSGAAIQLLSNSGQITPDERSILGGFQWTQNSVLLHSDISALPKRRSAWSAWNYVTESQPAKKGEKTQSNNDRYALSYLMNTLQPLDMDRFGPIICTLNPTFPLGEESIQARVQYEHPTFNAAAEQSQHAMPQIQNTRGISYAGAWMGYGFHEDGFTAGLRAAVALGDVKLPFEIGLSDRRVTALWTADVFDVLEAMRRLVSSFLVAVLFMVGIVV